MSNRVIISHTDENSIFLIKNFLALEYSKLDKNIKISCANGIKTLNLDKFIIGNNTVSGFELVPGSVYTNSTMNPTSVFTPFAYEVEKTIFMFQISYRNDYNLALRGSIPPQFAHLKNSILVKLPSKTYVKLLVFLTRIKENVTCLEEFLHQYIPSTFFMKDGNFIYRRSLTKQYIIKDIQQQGRFTNLVTDTGINILMGKFREQGASREFKNLIVLNNSLGANQRRLLTYYFNEHVKINNNKTK